MIIKEIRISDSIPYECKAITGENWRLIYNDKKVIAKIKGTKQSRTVTIHTVEEFASEEEALERIDTLGLIKDEIEKPNNINNPINFKNKQEVK